MEPAVAAAEQLVAAADRQECSAAGDDGLDQRGRLCREILRDEQLLAVLAAADVVEIVRSRDDRVVHGDRVDVELVSAPGCAACEHGDVSAVGVDIEVVRVEMADADPHAARSQ